MGTPKFPEQSFLMTQGPNGLQFEKLSVVVVVVVVVIVAAAAAAAAAPVCLGGHSLKHKQDKGEHAPKI